MTVLLSVRELRTHVLFHALNQGFLGVTLTLNIPGFEKNHPQSETFFKYHYQAIGALLTKKFGLKQTFTWRDPGGMIGYFILDGKTDAKVVKQLFLNYEDGLKKQGQLLDLDVYTSQKTKISRKQLHREARKCYLCDQPAKECMFKQTHWFKELEEFLNRFLVVDQAMVVFEPELKPAKLVAKTTFYEDFFKHHEGINQRIFENLQIIFNQVQLDNQAEIAAANDLMDQVCLSLSSQRYNLKKDNQTEQEGFLFRYEMLKAFNLGNLFY